MNKSENESESEYVISTERRNLEKLTKKLYRFLVHQDDDVLNKN